MPSLLEQCLFPTAQPAGASLAPVVPRGACGTEAGGGGCPFTPETCLDVRAGQSSVLGVK